MRLRDLCQAAGIEVPASVGEKEITGIAVDSRRVQAGEMYVCIRGLHNDGHTYIEDAVKAGAVCVIAEADAEMEKDYGIPIIKTVNTRRAAAYLYHAWYGFPSRRMRIIGVTGTNGKTSVTHMLKAILEAALCRCGIVGTVGCESAGRALTSHQTDPCANMTTPDPEELYRILWEMAEDGVEYVLMEVTSHALALDKVAPIDFSAAVFTNLTPEHLDFHKDMESYARAKQKLLARSALCVLNGDSDYLQTMRSACLGRTVICSERRIADYTAEEVSADACGVSYRLESPRMRQRLFCPVAGSFTVMNSMEAAVCALELGISPSAVKEGLASISGIRGRMERVRLGHGANFTVLIDYAHTPDALENLLVTAKRMKRGTEGRLVVLFGCGGDRDRGKRPVMGSIASKYADHVILTSDNSRGEDPKTIIEEILAGVDPKTPTDVIISREEAIAHAVIHAKEGDLILLAGKGHEKYEITRQGRRDFDEKKAVKQAFDLRRQRRNQTDNTEIQG